MKKTTSVNLTLTLLFLLANTPNSWSEGLHEIVAIGNSQFRMKNYSSAEKTYLTALEKSKESMELNFNYACALYKREQFDFALKYFHKAFERADYNARGKIFFNVGNTYYKLGQMKKASDMYKEALKLNPKDEGARHNLTLCIIKQREKATEEERLTFDETRSTETDEGSFISAVSEREDQLLSEKAEQYRLEITAKAGGVPQHLTGFAAKYKTMSKQELEKVLNKVAKDDLDILKESWRTKINHTAGYTSKGW